MAEIDKVHPIVRLKVFRNLLRAELNLKPDLQMRGPAYVNCVLYLLYPRVKALVRLPDRRL